MNPSPSCPLCHENITAEPIRRTNLLVHSCPNCGLDFGEAEEASATLESGSVDTSPHHFSMLLSQSGPLGAALADLIDRRWPTFSERLGQAPRHWLEIGPGSGLLSGIVADRGGSWCGCEIDPAMADEMKGRGLNVVNGDFSSMDPQSLFTPEVAKQGGFDIVFLSQVLEHVRNPDRFLANALLALRSGGLIYIDVPNGEGLTAIFRRLNRWGGGYGEIVPPYHMISYGARTMRYALDKAGFDQIDVSSWSYNDSTFGLAHARIHPSAKLQTIWNASAFLSLGGNLVAIGRKPLVDGSGERLPC